MGIQTLAIEKALRLLQASGASYHVIHDDKEWGEAIKPKRVKKESLYPRGALTAHVVKYVKDIKPNQTAKIPAGEYNIDSVRSTTTGYLSYTWGNGSYMIHKEPTYIEVLRLA